MNSQDSTQLVKHVYESFRNGDAESFLDALDADIEWHIPEMADVPFGGTWRSREGVSQFLRKLSESQEVLDFRAEQFIAQGNTVVVLGCFVMYVKSTGRESASDWAHVWTLNGGKVTHFREYVDTATVTRAHAPSLSGSRQLTASASPERHR
jgi:ketosteroid isomerase-like protein